SPGMTVVSVQARQSGIFERPVAVKQEVGAILFHTHDIDGLGIAMAAHAFECIHLLPRLEGWFFRPQRLDLHRSNDKACGENNKHGSLKGQFPMDEFWVHACLLADQSTVIRVSIRYRPSFVCGFQPALYRPSSRWYSDYIRSE